ncbi:MAG TPA: lytic murein transglycosylase, partial [Acetobacteraceae bacterium]|nr:lytic murein transglycosylase [Acetobacteraceae bacterium]
MMGLGLTALGITPAEAQDYGAFLSALRARALARGIPANIADAALDGLTPNQKIMKLDQHQAEFTMTWAEYSARVVSAARIKEGRAHALSEANLLAAVRSRFGVGADALLGIWGIETNFGVNQGDFQVIDALATLSYLRGSAYFGNEAIAAMRIAGSVNIPRGILESACEYGYEETVPELVTAREREIVVICRSGFRSVLSAFNMQLLGYTKVCSLKTGLRGWNDFEQPL